MMIIGLRFLSTLGDLYWFLDYRSLFLCCSLVVEGKEAFQELLARVRRDCVADTVVSGEGFDFVEVVAEVQVGPTVGSKDSFVQFSVEFA